MLAQMIAQAEQALHALYTGTLAVKVTIEGQETEFNKTNIRDLEAYVARLYARQAAGGGMYDRGAVGVIF